jgi:uncharacterized protein
MSTGTELWLFAVSLGASALGGMLGMASGIFVVPVLTMWGHIDIRSAIGASIVSVIAFSKGSLDECSPRNRTGDRDDGGRSEWRNKG